MVDSDPVPAANRMKVVFLNPSGQLGGAEWCLLDMLASLRAAKPDWSLHVVLTSHGPLEAKAAELGVPVMVIPFPLALARLGDAGARGKGEASLRRVARTARAGRATLGYLARLRRALRDLGPDLVHTNGFKMHILGVWSRPRGVPLVWHVHDYVSSRPVMARLLRHHSRRCAAIITNSRSVAQDVRAVCGAAVPVRAVHNAIDLRRFAPEGPALDLDALARLGPAEPATVRVGLVGTMARWKGHDVFLRALALLPRALPIRAYVVGGAIYETDTDQWSPERLKRLARELGVADRLGLTGFVDDPSAAMRSLDVVVHASTQPEPFGRVIVEAMACGRPVIVSGAGGAMELVRPEVDAVRHAPGDAVSLAGAIHRLVVDPELRARLGRTARIAAEARFDRARLSGELAASYARAMAGRRSRIPRSGGAGHPDAQDPDAGGLSTDDASMEPAC